MTNWNISQPPKIGVQPKLIYTSKSFLGTALTAASLLLPSLAQQDWIDPNLAKALSGIGTACGIVLSFTGSVDRPELFFRPGKMQEAVREAAKELTVEEGIKTLQQGLDALTAPPGERTGKLVQLAIDTQARFTRQDEQLARQDEVLARIEQAATANQFPPLADLPDSVPSRTNLGPNPAMHHVRREAPPPQLEMEPVEITEEPNVLQADSEGAYWA